jgi:sugar (pentulose or hexulose) kinase
MKPEPTILAIDNGTQSVRALLFDLRGNIVAKSQVAAARLFFAAPRLGRARAGRLLAGRVPRLPGAVEPARRGPRGGAAVAVTTQRGTVVNLGRDGKPLRPAITWLDQRRTEHRAADRPLLAQPPSSWRASAARSTSSAARPRSTGSARTSPRSGTRPTNSCCSPVT